MTAHLPDVHRPALGALMSRERRWSQLHRCDDRLVAMAEAAEALAAAEAHAMRLAMEAEPLPDEPVEDPEVVTESDVRRIALEVLGELLGVGA